MENDPGQNNPTAQNTPLSEEELEAIAGGAMLNRPESSIEEKNQKMVDILLKRGINITPEQAKDAKTLHGIAFSPFNQ